MALLFDVIGVKGHLFFEGGSWAKAQGLQEKVG